MRIIVANLGPHGGRRQADHLAALEPDVVLACEVGSKPTPDGMDRHQRGVGRGQRDCAIFTRDEPSHVAHVRLADGIRANDGGADQWHRNAPPRWALGARIDGIAYWSVHLHYPTPLTFGQWRESLRRLESRIRVEQEAGRPVVVGGDLNSIRRFPPIRSARAMVEAMFKRVGLHWYAPRDDVMWLAWTPGTISNPRRVKLRGSDHPVTIVAHVNEPPTGEKPADTEDDLMAYNRLPDNLPRLLRDAGLKVREVDGWRTRGRPASTGGFDPVGVLCHHTATSSSSSDDNVVRLLVDGRPDLPGPLCQLGLARDGTVYVVASGRANHAGTAKASGSVAAGDGNSLYVGVEAFNDGRGEPWGQVQLDAYVTLAATLCRLLGSSERTVRGHKETSVTGKIDPTFNMDVFRSRVAAALNPIPRPEPEPAPDPMEEEEVTPQDIEKIADAVVARLNDRGFWQRVLNTDLTPNVDDGANTIRNALRDKKES